MIKNEFDKKFVTFGLNVSFYYLFHLLLQNFHIELNLPGEVVLDTMLPTRNMLIF